MMIYSKDNECLINLPKNKYWAIVVDRINEKWGITLKSDGMAYLLKNYETYDDAKEYIKEIVDTISFNEEIIEV